MVVVRGYLRWRADLEYILDVVIISTGLASSRSLRSSKWWRVIGARQLVVYASILLVRVDVATALLVDVGSMDVLPVLFLEVVRNMCVLVQRV